MSKNPTKNQSGPNKPSLWKNPLVIAAMIAAVGSIIATAIKLFFNPQPTHPESSITHRKKPLTKKNPSLPYKNRMKKDDSKRITEQIDKKILPNSIGMNFVYISPGTFPMGWRKANKKQFYVTLTKGFYMQTTEVTQAQWKAVMGNNPSHFRDCGDDCPVELVSWHDVQEFIAKLNRRVVNGKYRLPTDAEWEYACKAGHPTGIIVSSGMGKKIIREVLGRYSWYRFNSNKKTHPVRKKIPNNYGLYDMCGNVIEWVQDWVGGLPADPVTDYKGPKSGRWRTIRGGGWTSDMDILNCNFRFPKPPGERSIDIGFRCVREE